MTGRPNTSDQEFVRACLTSKSITEICKKTKTIERAVRRRIKRLEPVYGPLNPVTQKLRIPSDTINYELKSAFTAVVFSDCHYWPGHITPAHSILLKVLADIKPKMIIANGDILDGYSIKRHPDIMWEDGPTLADELDTLELRMGEIEEASPKSILVRTIGNHDLRFESYLSNHAAQYKDVHGSSLDDHLPSWQSGWSIVLNDHTVIKHRLKGGKHAAYGNAMDAGVNIITGHTHRLTERSVTNYRGTHKGIECGTLADPTGPQFNYTEHAPLDWVAGFVVLHVEGDRVFCELVEVQNGMAYFGGKKYIA